MSEAVQELFAPENILRDMTDARNTIYDVQGVLHLALRDAEGNDNHTQSRADVIRALHAVSSMINSDIDDMESVLYGLEQMT